MKKARYPEVDCRELDGDGDSCISIKELIRKLHMLKIKYGTRATLRLYGRDKNVTVMITPTKKQKDKKETE